MGELDSVTRTAAAHGAQALGSAGSSTTASNGSSSTSISYGNGLAPSAQESRRPGRPASSASTSGSSPWAAKGRRSQIVWTVALAGVAWLIRRWQQTPSLINPPYCAWRFVGNHDAWNVAFPDMRSMYHVMQMNIDPGDEFKIVAESFPYARYMSYQTYELRRLMSQKSLRDVDIVPENGPNCYANLTAAVNGEKQGGYTIHITPHGDKNYTNELPALAKGVESGHFDVFFRIYVEESQQGPPQAPWGHLPAYGPEYAFEWGWAPPPKVYVKRAHWGKDEWRELPFCRYRRRTGFKLLAYLSEMARPPANPFPDDTPAGPNKQGNTFLPRMADRAGKFASKDANYVASVAEPALHVDGESSFLFARLTARLPTVPGSLYSPPYVANVTDYDVRYVSLSAVHRTVPFRNHATVSDTRIIEHYRSRLGDKWDGRYVIWIVPPEVDALPARVQEEDAIVMRWGASIFDGKTIAYPGLLYRQVMAQSQVLPAEEHPLHPSGVVNIVPEVCGADQPGPQAPGAEEAFLSGEPSRMHPYCCSSLAPMACYMPEYVRHRMGPYYPEVEYYKGGAHGEALALLEG